MNEVKNNWDKYPHFPIKTSTNKNFISRWWLKIRSIFNFLHRRPTPQEALSIHKISQKKSTHSSSTIQKPVPFTFSNDLHFSHLGTFPSHKVKEMLSTRPVGTFLIHKDQGKDRLSWLNSKKEVQETLLGYKDGKYLYTSLAGVTHIIKSLKDFSKIKELASLSAPIIPIEIIASTHPEGLKNIVKNIGLQGGFSGDGIQQLSAFEEFIKRNQHQIAKDTELATTLHSFLGKVALTLMKEGHWEMALECLKLAAIHTKILSSHPLYKLKEVVQNQTSKQTTEDFGAHFSSLDTGILKGGNIRVLKRKIDGVEKLCLDFKINQNTRRQLERIVQNLEKKVSSAHFKEALPQIFQNKPISVHKENYTFLRKKANGDYSKTESLKIRGTQAKVIKFEGLGKIYFGDNPHNYCLHNNISVELEGNLIDPANILHQMFTLLGLGPILLEQRPIDDEKMKIAQLFRAFFPKEAHPIERSELFFEMTRDQLMTKIERECPGMKPIFQKYLKDEPHLMKKEEIYPGKTIWSISDFANEMKKRGAFGLMTGVYSIAQAALMVKNGALSSQDRFQAGLIIEGASSEEDLSLGSGDQVFTRLINKKTISEDIDYFSFSGQAQIIIDLSVLNRGGYAYDDDEFGEKSSLYRNRKSLLTMAKEISSDENEVMVKNRIDPKYIKGVVVQSKHQKKQLVQHLKKLGLIKKKEQKEMDSRETLRLFYSYY